STRLIGVAELGLISGTGMLINFALSMTLLPALLTLLPAPPVRTRRPADTVGERIAQLARRQRRGIRLAALLMGGAALWMAPQLEFDRNPLNLRPPTSESLATLRELMATSDTPPMHITVLAADETAARRLQGALRGLPSVRDALMLDDLLPAAGAGKRARIDVIDRAIGDSLQAPASPAPTPGAPVAALRDLRDALLAPGRSESLQRLGSSLEDLVPELESAGQREQAVLLRDIEARWLDNFAGTLATLRLALRPGAASIDRIPAQLRERWVASPGPWRIVVYPTDNIDDRAALSTFVREVQTVAPNATDEPVLSLAAGDAVVRAFQQAFSGSLIVISLLLALYLRNLGAALAVLSPLLLAGLVTTAAMVLLGEALNFANVIALPLLFGIGVDNGVHMVHRAHGDPGKPIDPLATSTGRGVLFSTLTTVCGFGNLLFSPHPGTASIGLVLTVGISATIVCTLIVLPALLVLPREK
ncbi:MAG: MMPL family transporter, partial [Gammaproteobacteria bacterium]